MAHAWVQTFDTQYDAFRAYCEIYPDNPVLLVDTYNTLKAASPTPFAPSMMCSSPGD